jgi:hypothetical protein
MKRLELLLAMLIDECGVPPLKLARIVDNIRRIHRIQPASLEAEIQFRTWHHDGLRAFVRDLAKGLIDENDPRKSDQ